MLFLDLFAGIGGFRRGMELAGHKCIGFCEFDKFATASYTSMHLVTDEQRERLSKLTLKQRQKEILEEEYRNGEWYSSDIREVNAGNVPKADCWCFGAPCQDFSIAGRRVGLDGDRSSLVREVFRILWEIEEKDRPEWLIYENVKGMLSSNRGWDYLAILMEMDELGYDIEWQNINSKNYVPQNRERIYTVGHLRAKGSAKILPIMPTDEKDSFPIEIIGHRNGYRRNTQIFSPDGITESLDTGAGGGRGHNTIEIIGLNNGNRKSRWNDRNRVLGVNGECVTLTATGYKEPVRVGVTVVADRPSMFGIDYNVGGEATKKEHPGQYVELSDGCVVYAVWHEKYQCYIAIRKLTPKECFRLQGWDDDCFDKAQFVNSDSQLYRQAGNGVTVPVVYEIGKAIG